MPRVANTGAAVDTWYLDQDEDYGSSTHDLCSSCFASYEETELCGVLKPYQPEEPMGGWWEELDSRPSYDELDVYYCAICDDILEEDKDG